MIEFNRKLELLELSFKYGGIKKLFDSDDIETCNNEEKEFLYICLDLLVRNYKTEGKIPLSKKGEELLIFLFNFGRIKDGDIPRYIYRYDSCKNAKESIEGKYIWMSSNLTFNDPFEGILHGDYENAKINELTDCYFENPSYTEQRKFKEKLKKTKEIKKIIEEIKKKHKNNIEAAGIFCCSEISDNITMWSHYSEKHQGVCLEFDILKDSSVFEFVNKMKYTDVFPPKTPLSEVKKGTDKEKSLLNVSLLTKSKCWENEKEIRVIKIYKTGKIEIKNPDCLKSVIFGLKCEKKFKRELIKIMREKGYNKNTEIKKAVKAENAYKLEIKPIGVLSDPLEELTR